MGGIHLPDKKLRDTLLAQAANYGSCPVVLLAPAECSFGRIRQTLDILGSAGVWDVRFALASATNSEVRFTPMPIESVHVPWCEVAALISGNEVLMKTNSDEVAKSGTINTATIHVRFDASQATTAEQLFTHLWAWQSQGADLTRDKEIGSTQEQEARASRQAEYEPQIGEPEFLETDRVTVRSGIVTTGMTARQIKALLGPPDGMSLDLMTSTEPGKTNMAESSSMLVWNREQFRASAGTGIACHVFFKKRHPADEHPGGPGMPFEGADLGWIADSIHIRTSRP